MKAYLMCFTCISLLRNSFHFTLTFDVYRICRKKRNAQEACPKLLTAGVRVLRRSVQGRRGPAAPAHVQGELREPGNPAQRGGCLSGQNYRGLLDHGRICKSHQTKRCLIAAPPGQGCSSGARKTNRNPMSLLLHHSRFLQSRTVPATCSRVSFREKTTASLACKDSVTRMIA